MPLTHGLKFVDHEQKPGKIKNKTRKTTTLSVPIPEK